MWNLYDKGVFLEPLKFSNGKTQEDVVKEVIESIKEGNRIIFVHGMCGTGKSAIALNIAKNLGKSSIIVPGKSLQSQYKKDYEGDKYLLKDDNQKLRINVITGRNNHKCLFLQDKEIQVPIFKKEKNLKLNDIFSPHEKNENKKEEKSADNRDIPCKIEIKEKNFWRAREYLRQNKNVDIKNIQKVKDIKRTPLASVCPYWSPVLRDIYELKNVEYSKKRSYEGLKDIDFNLYQRKSGCGFYEQFNSYIDSDVIVFNSLKYKLESALNRKPKTEVEIIDECDEFLDSFSNQRSVNIDRLQSSLTQMFEIDENVVEASAEISELLRQIRIHPKIIDALNKRNIVHVKDTPVYSLIRMFLESNDFLQNIDEESYLFEFEETAKMFEDFLDETYLLFSRRDNNLIMEVVTTNLAKKFREMVEKNKVLVLMSGTLHSSDVLRDIYGLDKFKIIEAENKQPGKITITRSGDEFDCKYENFSNGNHTRDEYFLTLDKLVGMAKKPVLVHVNAFSDLPDENEIQQYGLKNLVSKDSLRELQNEDKEGELINKFKNGKTEILFTTRCARGVDFPGEQCNSIVFTKFPNPNPDEAFWKILRQTKPTKYWSFYKDKAKRELLQKLFRGLRFKDDHVFVLSPDKRVLDFFEREIKS